MKQTIELLKFWIISAIVIYISNLFFEYIINRSYVPEFIALYVSVFGIICSIVMVTIWIAYGLYLFNTIIKLLKL